MKPMHIDLTSAAPGAARVLVLAALGGLATVGCGSVTPLGTDGGAGHGGSSAVSSAGAGGGATGSAGEAGGGGATGSAGQGGTTGSAGHGGAAGGATGSAGQGGASGGGGHGGGGAGGANPCHGLTEMQCSITPGCTAGHCTCGSASSYAGCYQPSSEVAPPCPPVFCPASCAGLGEMQCLARTDCRTDYCPGCTSKMFVKCALPSDPQPSCPGSFCPPPCSMVTTLADCELRNDCHSVFVDPGTCGCAVSGCCAHFSSCADGDKAMCSGMPLCKVATPFCEAPYVVSYTATCYEGCVNKKDCAP
jgi:hypothetical protein